MSSSRRARPTPGGAGAEGLHPASEAVINANTFNYLTAARRDPFVLVNPAGRADRSGRLAANLHECISAST